jgi:methylated-DNA-protein-cysteine methyltransferase related protein
MDDFFLQVYKLVRKIPSGKVTTYGAIAACLGTPGAARMVGWAMNASHTHSEYVPAHRVVNRNGLLTGKHHFDTPDAMQELLENEGIEVSEGQIVNFSQHFWDPASIIDELTN